MRSPTFLTDRAVPLIADTSTVINLIATGCAPAILKAVPNQVVAVDVIPGELDTGRPRGRQDADRMQRLIAAGHIEIVTLGDAGWRHFESLVSGSAVETLDDGEAATIAYAVEQNAVAILDEKKGTRICTQRFPGTGTITTVDLLLHPQVRLKLGNETFIDAVFSALRDARMAVLPHQLDAVVRLIGRERATRCPSLSKNVRAFLHPSQVEVEKRA